MGLLDDAIREHLDLKRRRGADPSEIARLEREALGPVRREPFEPANEKAAGDAEGDDRSVALQRPDDSSDAEYDEEYYDEEETDDWGEPFEEEFERPRSRRSGSEPTPPAADHSIAEPPPEPDPERGRHRWRRSRRSSVPPEEAPPTQADPPADVAGGDETVDYGVGDGLDTADGKSEEAPTADYLAPPEDADVLEETPEFLQDAPEHDRLWFEQRPPRDFDFDD